MTAAPDGAVAKVRGVLVALADPIRHQILDLLATAGAATATALAGQLPVSRQAIVKHLAILQTAGLVVGGRVGREMRYSLRPGGLDATRQWMSALAAEWDGRLAAIKHAAEAKADEFNDAPEPVITQQGDSP